MALIVSAVVVYAQVINYDFINYDDPYFITENQQVKNGLSTDGIIWAFTSKDGIVNPLAWLSHMLDVQLFGLNPGMHHLISLLFHIMNTILLFFIFYRWSHHFPASASVAFIFSVHPLNVESVVWLAERRNVLSMFFFLLTIGAYGYYVKNPKTTRYLTVVLFFIFALMSKPMVITLPIVLLLLDYWPLGRISAGSGESRYLNIIGRLKEKLPLIILSLLSAGITLYVAKVKGSVVSVESLPISVRMANVISSYVVYIKKLIWPSDLAVFYPYSAHLLPSWQVVLYGLILAGMTFLAISQGKRRPYILVGWFWYLLTLIPVIGLVQAGEQSVADRFMYLPMIGLLIIAFWGLFEIGDRWNMKRLIPALVTLLILLPLIVAAHNQTAHWKNSIQLFDHANEVTRDNYSAHLSLGNAYAEQGKFETAVTHYEKVLEIRPLNVKAHGNLANALMALGRESQAVSHYKIALGVDPDNVYVLNNYGQLLGEQGKFDQAVEYLTRALKLEPDNADVHNNMGTVLLDLNKIDDAFNHFESAVRLEPDNAQSYNNLGVALFRKGNIEQAIKRYTTAIHLKPDFAEAFFNMGNAWLRAGKQKEAVESYQKAIALNPAYVKAHYNLGNLFLNLKREDEAMSLFQKVLELEPNFAMAHYNMGIIYGQKSMLEKASASFAKAMELKPDHAPAYLNMGITVYRMGKLDTAIAYCQKALKIRPDYTRAQDVLNSLMQQKISQ